jgi:hypothetical protein
MRSSRSWILSAAAAFVTVSRMLPAQAADTAAKVTFGAFVDIYYAWDFGRPPTMDRSFAGGAPFTTQPARHNEFNVNLAFIDARLESPDLRGRLALQVGTSVQSNYAGEPATGVVSGPLLSRLIQEAVVGVRLRRSLWIDAGIYLSHLGLESWISRDNLTYTRSLVADYSPYYQSGAKLTWSLRKSFEAQLHLVNGWQNISESNSGKGVGLRADWTPTPAITVSGYNLVSQEAGRRIRALHGAGAKATVGRIVLLAQADLGMQQNSAANGRAAHWYGYTAIGRATLSPSSALSVRFERFDDDEQIVLATGSLGPIANSPFRGYGESIGLDLSRHSRVLWRSELRAFQNSGASFPNGTSMSAKRSNAFAVTSLAISF